MNSKTNITVTLTRKEAECLVQMADYHVNDEQGDWMEWDKEEKEMIKYGNQARRVRSRQHYNAFNQRN